LSSTRTSVSPVTRWISPVRMELRADHERHHGEQPAWARAAAQQGLD
jgi:hypothetical protein